VGDDWSRDVEGARSAGFGAVWLDRHRAAPAADPRVPRITTLAGLLQLFSAK